MKHLVTTITPTSWLGILMLVLASCQTSTTNQENTTVTTDSMTAQADNYCQVCPAHSGTAGPDYSGKDMTNHNFTTMDKSALVNANFTNATLSGAQFENMDLSGANFTGADLTPSAKGATNLTGTTLTKTCFINAKADSTVFEFAVFEGTDFSCASLIYASFGPVMTIKQSDIRTKFVKTAVDVPRFPLASWKNFPKYFAYTDLSFTKFRGLTQQNIDFKGWNMSNAIMKGINLTGFDLSHCNFTSSDLTDATLKSVKLDSARMVNITLTGADLTLATLKYATLYDSVNNAGEGATLNQVTFTNADLSYSIAQHALLRGANLGSATLIDMDLRNAVLSSNATYSEASVSSATASRANFSYASLNAVSFQDTYLDNSIFEHCTMSNTKFDGSTLSSSSFDHSTLQSVSFRGAVMHNIIFTNTTFSHTDGGGGVDLSCTQLGGADFTNASVFSANFDNAVVPPDTACCKQVSGYKCGVDNRTGLVYGHTTLPKLTNKVTCPNGQIDTCSGPQWMIPHWTTSACNSDHQQEVVWSKPDCGKVDSSQIVVFKDPNLKKCVADQFFKGDMSKNMTKDMAKQVTSFSCSCYEISDLTGMKYFTGLQELDFSCNNITNTDVWTYFTDLQKLNIQDNQLPQLNLSGMSDLIQLNAAHNSISKVIGVELIDLYSVDLSHNALNTFPLNQLDYVFFADLSFNKLTTVGSLNKNTYLVTLYLENNSLSNIGSLSAATGLAYVNLACNPGLDCSTLGVSIPTGCGDNSGPGCQ